MEEAAGTGKAALARNVFALSLKEASIVLPQSIRRLAEREYANPVVSLYLQLNPEKLPEEKGPVRCFHSLKNSAFAKHRKFIEALPRPQKESLEHDVEEIGTFLAEHFVPTKLRSVIIFKAGEALNWIVGLSWLSVKCPSGPTARETS
jgi:hypothetical protein